MITADHPALPGHFPGQPIVPGVVLLATAADVVREAMASGVGLESVTSAKFLAVVRPEEPFQVEAAITGASARFTIRRGTETVASGALKFRETTNL